MKSIKKFFCQFDFYTAPATLRIKQDTQMKTCLVGAISLGLGIYFAYVFFTRVFQVLNFQKIQYTSSSTTIGSNETYAQFPMFGVNFDWLSTDQFDDLFEIQTRTKKNGTSKYINMRPCVPEDWILLGDDYLQQFETNDLQLFYCPDTTENFTLKNTFSQKTQDYITISLRPCNPSVVPSCNKSNIIPYLQDNTAKYSVVQLSVYFLDIGIYPEKENPAAYYINSDTKIQITSHFGGGASVEFSAYQITTDLNFLPWENEQTLTGATIDTVRNYQIEFTDATVDRIGLIYLTTNQNKQLIDRTIGKIDEVLSYAGGLFSLIIAFFGIFLQSYNQYKYELTVAEGSFKTDKQNKVATTDDLHIWSYIKYTIFDWVNVIFCQQIPWKDCKDINETRDEVTNHLEADRLLRRLNKIENGLKLCLSREEDVCVNLLGPPKLDSAKNNRLILDYYNQIINGRCPLTLEEINTQDKLSAYINLPQQTCKSSKIEPEANSIMVFDLSKMITNNKSSNIVLGDDDKLSVISNIMQTYPEIKKQAEQIELDEEYEKIQIEIAQSFRGLKPEVRAQLQERIPIHVLYRLLKRIHGLIETAKSP